MTKKSLTPSIRHLVTGIRHLAILAMILASGILSHAALPTITIDNTTGSDTAASGSGTPSTAITGTGASLNGTTSINLSADTPNLTVVPVDGSAVLWVATTSGQQYAKITAADNSTDIVTVATAFSVTESGRTWAIGGARKLLDTPSTRVLLTTATGALPGWTIILNDATAAALATVITIATSGDTTDGFITIKGATPHIVMTQSGTANHFASTGSNNPNYINFENLHFKNSNVTKTAAKALNFNTGNFRVRNCIFGDVTHSLLNGVARASAQPVFSMEDTEFRYCTGDSILGPLTLYSDNMWIHHQTGGTAGLRTSTGGPTICENSIFSDITGDAVNFAASTTSVVSFKNLTIDSVSGDGLDISAGVFENIIIKNNIFSNIGNYGIRAASGQANFQNFIHTNNYYLCTSDDQLNLTNSATDQALNPGYLNAGLENYAIGTALKALGYPLSTRFMGANQTTTTPYNDIGAVPRQEPNGIYNVFGD